jgi:murein DD-endopeptidase MepM/ murein hydrolase activator NlpD
MRAKMAGMFALGVACGALLLTMALWFSGGLRTASVFAGSKVPASVAVPAAAPLPVPAPPPTAPPATAPPDNAPPPPVATRPAEVGTPPLWFHLAMPIAGIDPGQLEDTFNEVHDGHKHEALDIPAPRGTAVMAVAEGNVVKIFTSKPGGLTVYQFDNTQTYCYYYAHMDRYATGLKENTLLRKGDVLGYVGSTGNASPSAPHLHFAVTKLGPDKKWWEGTAIDPLPLLK